MLGNDFWKAVGKELRSEQVISPLMLPGPLLTFSKMRSYPLLSASGVPLGPAFRVSEDDVEGPGFEG